MTPFEALGLTHDQQVTISIGMLAFCGMITAWLFYRMEKRIKALESLLASNVGQDRVCDSPPKD